jgi:hypothetical protein
MLQLFCVLPLLLRLIYTTFPQLVVLLHLLAGSAKFSAKDQIVNIEILLATNSLCCISLSFFF